MSIWGEARVLFEDLAKRRQAEAERAMVDGQINSAKAIEWRQRVLAEGRLGLIDPAPTPSRSPEQPE